jgi:glycosyltransferase involved in cell wall biosynthesis
MKTIAISMVKNEGDVIEGVVRHTLGEVDELIIADNMSTDNTRDILSRLAETLPIEIVDDPEPGYYQSRKMTYLANLAGERGADWIIPFDADELWYSKYGRIADALALTSGNIAPATMWNHFCTAVDPPGNDPFKTMEWRRKEPGQLPKVAFRWRPGSIIHQGNHGVTIPGPVEMATNVLEIRHFPYRSAEHFVGKSIRGAAAYKLAPDLPKDMGLHWRSYGTVVERYGPQALEGWFRDHFWYLLPSELGMTRDPAPYRRWEPIR